MQQRKYEKNGSEKPSQFLPLNQKPSALLMALELSALSVLY